MILILNSILLGIGLAMDAFSVSIVNGVSINLSHKRKIQQSIVFGLFQGIMPFIGWCILHSLVGMFETIKPFIPWIALGLLALIGGKMIKEGISNKNKDTIEKIEKLTTTTLLLQAVATSIDALSVGFTIVNYSLAFAIISSSIIAIITFIACMIGVEMGVRIGTKVSSKSSIIGGIILICIGLEIFITSFI